MQPARIVELLAPFLRAAPDRSRPPEGSDYRSDAQSVLLSDAQLRNISTYIDVLKRWNARVNLTAIRDDDEIVTRHFGESLFAARHLFPDCSASSAASAMTRFEVADVGSGAGFPGIPLKIWAPEISLTLIESNHKKATFLREVSRALTLTDVNIYLDRVETLADRSFHVVTLRAVERFESVLPIAASLVGPGGRLALLIGAAQLSKAQTTLPSYNWIGSYPIPGAESRILAITQRS